MELCSFCGKSRQDVRRLIAGPGNVYICDECISLCQEILTDDVAASLQAQTRWKSRSSVAMLLQTVGELDEILRRMMDSRGDFTGTMVLGVQGAILNMMAALNQHYQEVARSLESEPGSLDEDGENISD